MGPSATEAGVTGSGGGPLKAAEGVPQPPLPLRPSRRHLQTLPQPPTPPSHSHGLTSPRPRGLRHAECMRAPVCPHTRGPHGWHQPAVWPKTGAESGIFIDLLLPCAPCCTRQPHGSPQKHGSVVVAHRSPIGQVCSRVPRVTSAGATEEGCVRTPTHPSPPSRPSLSGQDADNSRREPGLAC